MTLIMLHHHDGDILLLNKRIKQSNALLLKDARKMTILQLFVFIGEIIGKLFNHQWTTIDYVGCQNKEKRRKHSLNNGRSFCSRKILSLNVKRMTFYAATILIHTDAPPPTAAPLPSLTMTSDTLLVRSCCCCPSN